jgi:hypothetical protein
VSFQISVLKVLAGHPGGRATVADLRHAIAILISSGTDWTDRTKRLAAPRYLQSIICSAGRCGLANHRCRSSISCLSRNADPEHGRQRTAAGSRGNVSAVACTAPDQASCRKPARPASLGAESDAVFRGRIVSCGVRHSQCSLSHCFKRECGRGYWYCEVVQPNDSA